MTEAASESEWQIAVTNAIHGKRIIQAGNFILTPEFGYGAEELFQNEKSSALKHIRTFSHHNYPQTVANTSVVPSPNLPQLMNHSAITANVQQYQDDVPFATSHGVDYVFGETNNGA